MVSELLVCTKRVSRLCSFELFLAKHPGEETAIVATPVEVYPIGALKRRPVE